jgi:hypothetical protein
VALDAHTNAQWAGPRVLPALNTTPAAPFVHCATLAGKELLPQISLNGQDETSSSLPFRFYDPPALLAISPTTGPALGGTHVYARGANLTRHGTKRLRGVTSGLANFHLENMEKIVRGS